MSGEWVYWRVVHIVLFAYHLAIGLYVFLDLNSYIEESRIDVYTRIPEVTVANGIYAVSADRKHQLFRVSPIEIHALVSCLTALSHFASFMVYKYGLRVFRPNPIRWIEYAITATLMTISGFIGIGNGDLFFLLSISLLGVILQYCGYKIEETACRNQWWPYFSLGVVIEIAIALPLIYGTAAASRETGSLGLTVILVCYMFYYSLFAVNSFFDAYYMSKESLGDPSVRKHEELKKQLRTLSHPIGTPNSPSTLDKSKVKKDLKDTEEKKKDVSFMVTDERYAILSVTSKTALFWITVGSLIFELEDDDSKETYWLAVLWVATFVPLGVLVVYLLYQFKKIPPFLRVGITFLFKNDFLFDKKNNPTFDYYEKDESDKRRETYKMNESLSATITKISANSSGQGRFVAPTLTF